MTPPAQALREAPAYPRTRPSQPRRKSGPAPSRPPRRSVSRSRAGTARGRGAAVLDRLLRGRGWVMLIGALLAGIVFLNVSVLELNRGIAATSSRSAQLEAQNSVLRTRLANVGSAEAIQRAAEARGFVLPQPGDIGYLHLRPGDAAAAARRLAAAEASGATSATASASTALTPSTSSGPVTAAPAASTVAPSAGATATAPSQTAAAGGTSATTSSPAAAGAPSAAAPSGR